MQKAVEIAHRRRAHIFRLCMSPESKPQLRWIASAVANCGKCLINAADKQFGAAASADAGEVVAALPL